MTSLTTIIAFFNLGAQELILLFFITFIHGVLLLIACVFYILTLQSTLNSISINNRKMAPNQVWLLLIPIFGLVWHFFIIRDMASSIHDEAVNRNIQLNELKPAYNIGLAMCIVSCLFFVPGAFIATLVLWILYWVKISGYKNQLVNNL
jgi:hypothetical protein